MLTDFWRDFIGIVGLALTILGLLYTIREVLLTKSAAQSAEEAAKKALDDGRRRFQQHAIRNAHRFINDLGDYATSASWWRASLRSNDLADELVHLITVDERWIPFIAALRGWGTAFQRLAIGEITRFPRDRWHHFHQSLSVQYDTCRSPL